MGPYQRSFNSNRWESETATTERDATYPMAVAKAARAKIIGASLRTTGDDPTNHPIDSRAADIIMSNGAS